MADTLQFGPEWLRTLSHGGASGSKSGSQGLAPSASRRPKQASLNYSRDEMLTVYESCTETAVPDGLLGLPDIAVDECQLPLASIPPSPEEQNLLSHASRGNASSIKLELEPTKHSGKGSWREGANVRDSDRESVTRGKHSRDDVRDESLGSLHRGRGGKDTTSSRHPEFSRSMSSDNWREAKKRDTETDAGSSWRSRQEHSRSVRSWRETADRDEARGGGRSHRGGDSRDSVHYDRGDYRRKRFDRNYGDDDDEEADLPEWCTVCVDDVASFGTFDASGAFMSKDECKDLTPFEFNDDSHSGLEGEELEPPAVEQLEDPQCSAISGDEAAVEDSDSKLAEADTASATEAATAPAGETGLSASASGHPAETHNTAEDTATSSQSAAEPDVDFSRLDIDAEHLVASLFGDDDSSVSFEQPPTDNKKGFVSADHEDAGKWFYQDPQGVIQGPFQRSEMAGWHSAGFFTHNLLVKRGADASFIQLGDLLKNTGNQDPFAERKSPVGPAVTAGGQAGDVPRVGSDQATAPPSVEQHLLQLLMRKQPAVAATTPQQQQALLQLLLQSQVSSAQAARQAPAAGAFSLANLSSTGSAAASVPTSQVPRPRAIKSQHSQPLPDAVLQQQQALQQDLLKTEAAKLAEASKLAELSQHPAAAAGGLTAEQKTLLRIITGQQQQPLPSRPVQHGQPAFHRSVSQPVDMDLTGVAAFASVAGWKGSADGTGANPSAMWRTSSVVPSTGAASWNQARMTVDELEKLQFLAAEKARQEAQKRQAVDAGSSAAVDGRQLEQLKAVLLQQIQQQQQRRDVLHDDRRGPADRLPTEFDLRERQRQEEIRRRQERSEELRRHQQMEMLRSHTDQQALQLALSTANGVSGSVDQSRRDFVQPADSHQMASLGQYWMAKDAASGKVAGLPQQQQWQNLPSSAGFSLSHSKTAAETSSWEDLAATVKSAGNGNLSAAQLLSQRSAPAAKLLKDEGLQKLVQVAAYKEEFARWCDATVKSLHPNINVPTFLRHLAEVDSPVDVAQYVRTYLGNSNETMTFVQQYLQKREIWRQQNKMLQDLVLQCMKGNK